MTIASDSAAAADKINVYYDWRVLRLTLLAPDVVVAIQNGRQPAGMTLTRLIRSLPVGPAMLN